MGLEKRIRLRTRQGRLGLENALMAGGAWSPYGHWVREEISMAARPFHGPYAAPKAVGVAAPGVIESQCGFADHDRIVAEDLPFGFFFRCGRLGWLHACALAGVQRLRIAK